MCVFTLPAEDPRGLKIIHLAQRHVHRLNRIGRIDDLADVLWKGKQWDHSGPVGALGLANTGVASVPFFRKEFHLQFGIPFRTGGVDGFEISGDRLDLLKGRGRFSWNIDDEIKHRVAWPISFANLPQTESQRLASPGGGYHDVRQLYLNGVLSPGARPCPLFVRSSHGKSQYLLIQIVPHALGLAHVWPVIARIRQEACFKNRNGLHFFIGLGETAVLGVEVACLTHPQQL
jgi:hypothetical protein